MIKVKVDESKTNEDVVIKVKGETEKSMVFGMCAIVSGMYDYLLEQGYVRSAFAFKAAVLDLDSPVWEQPERNFTKQIIANEDVSVQEALDSIENAVEKIGEIIANLIKDDD